MGQTGGAVHSGEIRRNGSYGLGRAYDPSPVSYTHLDVYKRQHLYLLPALPEALAQGCVRGLRSKGGLTVSMEWEKGKLIYAEVTGKTNGTVILNYEGGQEERLEGSVSWRYGDVYKRQVSKRTRQRAF